MYQESLPLNLGATPIQNPAGGKVVLRWLADTAMSILWMTDADDVCIFLNKSTQESFQHAGEVRVSDWFAFIHPDDFEKAATKFSSAKKAREEYQGQYRIIRSDGTIRWMLGSGAPRFTRNGEFDGYNGAILDITAQQNAFERLAESEAEYRLLAENTSDHMPLRLGRHVYLCVAFTHQGARIRCSRTGWPECL